MELHDSQSGKDANIETETSSSIPTKSGEYSTISSSLSKRTETSSQPVNKIFVEDDRGFRVVENYSEISGPNSSGRGAVTPSDIALKVENCFHTFSHFCHGLLAGIALWQCILVFQLSDGQFELTDFVEHYGLLAQPFHTVLFFLCTICTISVFDKFDLANLNLLSAKSLFCSSKVIVLLLYPLCLLFSISLRNVDDLFSLYQTGSFSQNSTHFQTLTEEFYYWKYMNTVRCLLAIFGWFAIILSVGSSFSSKQDHSGRKCLSSTMR